MSTAVIGIVLIILGVLAILFMPQGAQKPLTEEGDNNKSTEASNGQLDEEDSKKKAEANAQDRQKQLENIVAPSGAPPLRIYFGS